MEILEHFSAEPLGPPRDSFQEVGCRCYEKPRGLWLSVRGDDDWLEWCKAERFRTDEAFKVRTVVRLNPQANILWIRSVPELDAFDAVYGGRDPRLPPIKGDDGYSFRGINWSTVAADYDGIIIAPYLWERRLSRECPWYYGWDCASGCIWNAKAIDRFEEIDPPIIEAEEEEAAEAAA